MLVSPARSKLAEVLLIFLCVSCSYIPSVYASASGSTSSQVNGQEPTQSGEVDVLVQTGFELYEHGQFEEAVAYATKEAELRNAVGSA